MRSNVDAVTILSLRNVQKFVQLPLKSQAKCADEFTSATVSLLSTFGASENEISRLCLQCVSYAVLETSQIDDGQLRILLRFARDGMDKGSQERNMAALGLLKGVVAKAYVVPEVYEIIDDVCLLGLRSQLPSVRSAAMTVVVHFLLNYPMSHKRMRQHLDFFVKGLSYEYSDGRMASLSALNNIVTKFPTERLDEEAEYLFIALCTVIVNDDTDACRNKSREVLKKLFSRLSSRRIAIVTSIVETWLSQSGSLLLTGAESLVSLFESDTISDATAKKLMGLMFKSFKACNGDRAWLPSVLVAVEKVHQARKSLCLDAFNRELWDVLISEDILADCDSQSSANINRVLMHYFNYLGNDSLVFKDSSDFMFGIPGAGRYLMRALCEVNESDVISEELSVLLSRNIISLLHALLNTPSIGDVQEAKVAAVETEELQDCGLENFKAANRGLHWLMSRLSSQAVRIPTCARRLNALGLLHSILERYPDDKRFMFYVVRPLVHAVESAPSESDKMEMKFHEMGVQTQEMLEKLVGHQEFLKIYTAERQKTAHIKEERKKKRKAEELANPELAAKKKIKRNAKKKPKHRNKDKFRVTK